jgi:hypothetical protein
MAFMFETRAMIRPTRYALETPLLQRDYGQVWQDLRRQFTPPPSAEADPRAAPGAAGRGVRSPGRTRVRKRSRR